MSASGAFSVSKNYINLSSTDRISGTNNDFIIQFNSSGLTSESNGYFGSKSFINPIFFSLPNNWQNIQAGYNDVYYIVGAETGATPHSINATLNLPAGVYQTVAQLCFAIQTQVRAALTTAGFTIATGFVCEQLLSPTTNINWQHIRFDMVGAAGTTINLYFTEVTPVLIALNPYNFATLVGVDSAVITLNSHVATVPPDFTGSVFAEYVPQLNIYDMIQIQCNLCNATYEIENNTLSPSIIMVSFPVGNNTVNNQVVFLNNNPQLYRQQMRTSNFDTIQIRVVDKQGRLIPFFGECDLSIIIEREVLNEPQNLQRIKDQNPYSVGFI